MTVDRPLSKSNSVRGAGPNFQTETCSRVDIVSEIVFEITQESDGGYCAECLTESIFTQADTWDELRANVRDVVEAFYFDSEKPSVVRLHLVRDEVLALG
jgi:hypothetical protein